MLKKCLFGVIFLLMCAYGYLSVENINSSGEIRNKAEDLLEDVAVMKERVTKKVEQVNSLALLTAQIKHLISIKNSLAIGTILIKNNNLESKEAVMEIRSYEAKTALEVLDEMKDNLTSAKEDFPVEKFNNDLNSLKEEFKNGDPDIAIGNLSLMIDFLATELEKNVTDLKKSAPEEDLKKNTKGLKV